LLNLAKKKRKKRESSKEVLMESRGERKKQFWSLKPGYLEEGLGRKKKKAHVLAAAIAEEKGKGELIRERGERDRGTNT